VAGGGAGSAADPKAGRLRLVLDESSSFLVETVISLARSTEAHRVIVASDHSSAMYFELTRTAGGPPQRMGVTLPSRRP
jgi:hypothetical protein